MYPYYSEFDTPKDILIFLKRKSYNQNQDFWCKSLSIDFYQRHQELLKKLAYFHQIIVGSYEQFYFLSPTSHLQNEKVDRICHFFSMKEENFDYLQAIKDEIVFDSLDMHYLLFESLNFINCLIDVDTPFSGFYRELKGLIKAALQELETVYKIQLPPLKEGVKYTFPNAWMMSPTGHIYNTGGKDGHKEGNFIYPYYFEVRPRLEKNLEIPAVDYTKRIAAIKKCGYVTSAEFGDYMHLDYDLPTIWTPEIEHEKKRYDTLMAMEEKEYRYFFEKMRETDTLPNSQRSYQTLLCQLVVGYFVAKSAFYQSFSRLNPSVKKKELIEKIESLACKELSEILIRFSGFHKVETCERKITTSSLSTLLDFKPYLDAGWDIYLVPKIVYDTVLDDIVEQDFNWYFIDTYLTEILNSYKGKGRILVRGKNI